MRSIFRFDRNGLEWARVKAVCVRPVDSERNEDVDSNAKAKRLEDERNQSQGKSPRYCTRQNEKG